MRLRDLVIVCTVCLVLSGCRSSGPLVHAVTLQPDVVSPNADGKDDVARIRYSLARPARVSIYLVDAQGRQHVFRSDAYRPTGSYEALFSGVIADRLLADGRYTCVIEAQPASGGAEAKVELALTISGGQATRIEIRNLSIQPAEFEPNRDGIRDRVTIGYYLTTEAAKVQVSLLSASGQRYPVPEDKIRPTGQVGNHEHDYDAGVDLGATPPPNGAYTVLVEAEDAVGNRATARGSLTIRDGGVPQAEIVNRAAQWSASTVPLGGTLTFTCTVRNNGRVAIRTKGPPPGTTYRTDENFNSKAEYEEPGIFRIGLDYDGNSSGRVYPFRWALGAESELTVVEGQEYLQPGQTVTIVGHLRIVDRPVKVTPYYWIGLVHEQVRIVDDKVESTPITIGF